MAPSSYLLAARHPDRVTCLLQIDAISMRYVDKHPTMQRLTWSSAGVSTVLWLLDHMPGPTIRVFVGTAKADTPSREDLVRVVRALTLSGAGWPVRRDGYTNDMEQLTQLPDLPFSDITCPTLIIHGTADWDVVPEHAERAHARIAGSRLSWIKDGSHLGFFLSPATQTEALDWLASSHT